MPITITNVPEANMIVIAALIAVLFLTFRKSQHTEIFPVSVTQELKGLGILTIATILAETNGFDLFKNYKQLVSYAGFDVVESQSGARIGKTKISKKGNSRIRRALHMPSLVVITYKEKPFFKNRSG